MIAATAAMPELICGMTMRTNACQRAQPSISAASSGSAGISRTCVYRSQVASGLSVAMNTMTSPRRLSISWWSARILNSEITTTKIGTIIVPTRMRQERTAEPEPQPAERIRGHRRDDQDDRRRHHRQERAVGDRAGERPFLGDGAAGALAAGPAQQVVVGIQRRLLRHPAGGHGVHLSLGGDAGGDADQDRADRPDHDRHDGDQLDDPPADRGHTVALRSTTAYSAPNTAVTAASRNASAVPCAKSAWANVVL